MELRCWRVYEVQDLFKHKRIFKSVHSVTKGHSTHLVGHSKVQCHLARFIWFVAAHESPTCKSLAAQRRNQCRRWATMGCGSNVTVTRSTATPIWHLMSRRSPRLKTDDLDKAPTAHSVASSSSCQATRPVPKKRKVSLESNIGTEDVEGQSKGHVAPTMTKASENRSKAKGRRGSLKMVIDMPVDILLEIFQYVNPADLLNLSRTDRTLRAYVLKRSVALPWWQAVRFPWCPFSFSVLSVL